MSLFLVALSLVVLPFSMITIVLGIVLLIASFFILVDSGLSLLKLLSVILIALLIEVCSLTALFKADQYLTNNVSGYETLFPGINSQKAEQ